MNSGTGPGAITPDGCAVELYALLSSDREPDIIGSAVPRGASILELGCGAGRITHSLIGQGYQVTAVDQSPEMLAHVRGAEVILGDIETLDLHRTFDAVILASFLILVPDARLRAAFATTCRKHTKRGGVILIERWPEALFRDARVGPVREFDGVRTSWLALERNGNEFRATIEYIHTRGRWTTTFSAAMLSDADLLAELRAAGLTFLNWLDDKQNWLLATPA